MRRRVLVDRKLHGHRCRAHGVLSEASQRSVTRTVPSVDDRNRRRPSANYWPGLKTQVALADLTHGSVEAALAEAEAIGREAFLAKYGFGPARSYFIEWNGEHYDSKAIAGAAHGHLPGQTAL